MSTIGKRHYKGDIVPPERKQDKFKANEQITWHGDVRVIDDQGDQLGIMSVVDAQSIADERGLDLVEIAENSEPPVCRIMDYGKYLYDQTKKEKQAKKNSRNNELKEIKFRCKIADNDLLTKVKQIDKFLCKGNPVRITIMFRGREVTHPELAYDLLQKVIDSVKTECSILKKPEMMGRNISMTISPNK